MQTISYQTRSKDAVPCVIVEYTIQEWVEIIELVENIEESLLFCDTVYASDGQELVDTTKLRRVLGLGNRQP